MHKLKHHQINWRGMGESTFRQYQNNENLIHSLEKQKLIKFIF